MLYEEEYKQIEKAVKVIEGKQYITTSKTKLKALGFRYNIFKGKWIQKNNVGMVKKQSLKLKDIGDGYYLLEINLKVLKEHAFGFLLIPNTAKLIDEKLLTLEEVENEIMNSEIKWLGNSYRALKENTEKNENIYNKLD